MFFLLANKIEVSCKATLTEGNRDNAQYLEEIIPSIKKLVVYLPMCCSIMHKYFLDALIYASSASVESNFKTLKHSFFPKGSSLMRLNKFVFEHIKQLDGSVKLASASASTVRQDSSLKEREQVENWKNQTRIKARKIKSYLNTQPEWSAINLNEALNVIPIGLLRNGNSLTLRPLKINNKDTILSNTCAFDSLIQIICSAYSDSTSFRSYIRKNVNELTELVTMLTKTGVSRNIYALRAKILTNLFECNVTKQNIQTCDTTCSISDLFRILSAFFPNSDCNRCVANSFYSPNFFITINSDETSSKQLLQNKIVDVLLQRKCTCNGTSTHIFIETATPNIELNLFPEQLHAYNQIYYLRGIIVYHGSWTANTVGHFIAYC